MILRDFTESAALLHVRHFQTVTGHPGHNHFFQRAIGRRAFLRAATAAAIAPALLGKRPSSSMEPRPIPGGNQFLLPDNPTLFHVYPPAEGLELSTITDFNGFIGATELQGFWTKESGPGPDPVGVLNWDADMRFMVGNYIGIDAKPHQGTFGFI
jgi:hypothetical protein